MQTVVMVCKLVPWRYSILIKKVTLAVPMSLEAPWPAVVETAFDRRGWNRGILGQAKSYSCGMEILREDLGDSFPQPVNLDIGTESERQLLDRGE